MSGDDGERLHHIIAEELKRGNTVAIDFQNVAILLSAFLNPAIGALYREFTPEDLNKQLVFENYSTVQSRTISDVLANAKDHIFEDKGDRARQEALKEMFPE